MIRKLTFLLTINLSLFSCSQYKDDSHYIKIITAKGEIVICLYNQTPKHRDNILKLAQANFYDGQIFHRIINNFVIQGGDPTTKNAQPDSAYGEADSGYLLDAEFIDSLIHKRGALGMARNSDDVNPEKKSSGSQFYIVKGKVLTNQQLDELERKRNIKNKSILYKEILSEKFSTKKTQTKIDSSTIYIKASVALDSIWATYPKFKFSQKQRRVYTTIGGIPHLDGNYTVFGEVIKGMDIVDELSTIQTDKNDRPIQDIKFNVKVIK